MRRHVFDTERESIPRATTFLLVAVVFVGVAFGVATGAQAAEFDLDEKVNASYGAYNTERAEAVIQTDDGGFALVGETTSFGPGLYNTWLVKVNANGTEEFNTTVVPWTDDTDDYATDAIQTNDGGYAIAGVKVRPDTSFVDEEDDDAYLVVTDANGTVEVNETFGGQAHERFQAIAQADDGGYALAGTFPREKDADGLYGGYSYSDDDAWLVITDSQGNVEFNRTYSGRSNSEVRGNGTDSVNDMSKTADGGYVIVGQDGWRNETDVRISYYAAWLVKTDSNGNVEFDKRFNGSYDATAVTQTDDGGYAVAGRIRNTSSEYDAWFVKTDASGTIEINKTFDRKGDDRPTSVVQTDDGGYALAIQPKETDTSSNKDAWLVTMDANGTVETNQTFGADVTLDNGSPITGEEEVNAMVQTSDGDLALAGESNTFSDFYFDPDAWLLTVGETEPTQTTTTDGAVPDTTDTDLTVETPSVTTDSGTTDVDATAEATAEVTANATAEATVEAGETTDDASAGDDGTATDGGTDAAGTEATTDDGAGTDDAPTDGEPTTTNGPGFGVVAVLVALAALLVARP